MKKLLLFAVVFIVLLALGGSVEAQCSLCTKTAQQMGEKPAMGLNQGILYLMGIPYILVGVVAFKWWKGQKEADSAE
ncbi:MAG: hypothetical protein ACOYKE_01350 [Ferruginibacter sp.]